MCACVPVSVCRCVATVPWCVPASQYQCFDVSQQFHSVCLCPTTDVLICHYRVMFPWRVPVSQNQCVDVSYRERCCGTFCHYGTFCHCLSFVLPCVSLSFPFLSLVLSHTKVTKRVKCDAQTARFVTPERFVTTW